MCGGMRTASKTEVLNAGDGTQGRETNEDTHTPRRVGGRAGDCVIGRLDAIFPKMRLYLYSVFP